MRKIRIFLILAAILSTQSVFADDMSSYAGSSKPCADIVNACLSAGFTRESPDKKFWQDCMKPILLGKTVSGVTVDAGAAKACRTTKIEEMKKELKEFEHVKSSK